MGEPGKSDIDVEIERLFWKTDLDRKGSISMKELFTLLVNQGYKMSWEEFQNNFSSFDTDGNNEISYDEYLRGMGRPPKEWKRFELYRKLFRRYDKAGDGYITPADLAGVFKELGISTTPRQLTILFSSMDLNNSGKIEYDEFLRFFFNVKLPL